MSHTATESRINTCTFKNHDNYRYNKHNDYTMSVIQVYGLIYNGQTQIHKQAVVTQTTLIMKWVFYVYALEPRYANDSLCTNHFVGIQL